ncbi:MAG: hypothetical protein K9J13_03355 [Saprospiraceae bacterium]|nr:hypothetical protein [Saprospiraceae bacterium]
MSRINFYILIILSIAIISCNQPKSKEVSEQTIKIADSLSKDSANSEIIVVDSFYANPDYEETFNDEYVIDSAAVGINFKAKGSYANLKTTMIAKQQEFKQAYNLLTDSSEKKAFRDSTAKFLTDKLLNDFIPHWYGTEWDYNGTSEIPGSGYIACGYFVSTTLKHLGFNLNRYKFAQQSGLNGAKTIQMGEKLKKYYSRNDSQIPETLVKELKPGLYQVGLSCHVGYLLIKNQKAWFIHSNYFHSGVMIENAAHSDAFASTIYIISDITFNDKLIGKWILGEEIEIVRE